MKSNLPSLYPIIDPQFTPRTIGSVVKELGRAGVSLVQLREKKSSSRKFFQDSGELLEEAKFYGMTVIINDRVDIAWLAGAHGVHLGREDLPVDDARKILGPDKMIGYSAHNLEQAIEAQATTADYIAIGPVYATTSKENPDPVVKRSDLQRIRKEITKPLVAIGGITAENAQPLFDLGIDSVAVIRDILCAENVAVRVEEFLRVASRS
jgi:thiamine-phosphate pyrophosphorylase